MKILLIGFSSVNMVCPLFLNIRSPERKMGDGAASDLAAGNVGASGWQRAI
jgi:hypothetical protein